MSERILTGRTAIVTGASRGIGKAIALAFAREGADVVVTGRATERLDATAAEIAELGSRALVVRADMTVDEDVTGIADAAVARFGRIDVLVNNAGIVHAPARLVDFDPDLWREVVQVNLIAVALLTRSVLPHMIERTFGKIVNVSSIGGRRGGPGQTAYKATKAALINLTESVAAEVKEHGIDVNCICPGGVETEGLHNAFGDDVAEKLPVMPASAIADLALFLVSEQGAALVGATIDAFGWSSPIFAPPVGLDERMRAPAAGAS